ncbi:MAG: hypothetical protein ACOYWZ_22035 [Bacillota bacterium]
MIKRIMAWILLAGFVFLLLNITLLKIQWGISLALYAVIAVLYFLFFVVKKQ